MLQIGFKSIGVFFTIASIYAFFASEPSEVDLMKLLALFATAAILFIAGALEGVNEELRKIANRAEEVSEEEDNQ